VHPVAGGRLGVDLGGGSGRGAYVCPRHVCLEQAVKRGEFARCLKVTVAPMTVETLEGLIRERASRKVTALLGLARRARKVASGTEAVDWAVKRHAARLILSATDASANSVAKLRSMAARVGIAWMQAMGKEELGAALGGGPRVCIAVTDPHFAGALMSTLNKLPVVVEAREATRSDRRVGRQSGASEGVGVIRRGND
jgi:ribosomal protein L7Ae-like RNA K-turn-binding protein